MTPSNTIMVGGMLAVVVLLLTAAKVSEESLLRRPEKHATKHRIRVNQLPGYTGWARPSSTLADIFHIVDANNNTAHAGSDWEIRLLCNACANFINPAILFVRAYGPAILTGMVHSDKQGMYSLTLHPMHSGKYILEVVVAYSLGIDFSSYPLSTDQLPPQYYEGYLVNGFPIEFEAVTKKVHETNARDCGKDDLLFSSSSKADLWQRGTWRITSTNYENSFGNKNDPVSLVGYQTSQNSIGFTAEYELNSGCRLPVSEKLESEIPCAKKRIRIILIGDSVMRLQRDLLLTHLDPKNFEIEFFELYGGILLCSRVSGPNISEIPHKFSDHASSKMDNIVIFNSGMHDIHRLCGHQYMDERRSYLSESEMAMPCMDVYRRAMTELAISVRQIPSIVRVFQTTHAAWPKYGNYGIAWDPRYAQELPLDSAFVQCFNDIAVEVIEQLNAQSSTDMIALVDTFWMTLARPDNRETNKNADIGKKLSHPGREVVSNMVRLLWRAVLLLVCDPL